jgi:alpha-beta hydrolase superfamily lysophospholipase
LLHGFGTTGDMWGHLASALVEDHTIVVPDLRGLGLSSKPDGGYDKKNQAADVLGVLDTLGVRTAELVTHRRVQRRVSERGAIQVCGRRVHVGLPHPGQIAYGYSGRSA